MKNFNAKKIKEITNDYYNAEFEGVKNEIIEQAVKGKHDLEVEHELNTITILRLEKLGFHVTSNILVDVQKFGIYHVISWKTV